MTPRNAEATGLEFDSFLDRHERIGVLAKELGAPRSTLYREIREDRMKAWIVGGTMMSTRREALRTIRSKPYNPERETLMQQSARSRRATWSGWRSRGRSRPASNRS